jgi:hypothetical protein
MKKVNKLPQYKCGWASQFKIKINGKEYKVFHSRRSYAIAKKIRMFVCLNNQWYELEENEKNDVY